MPRPIHILVTLDWAKNSYARCLMTLATTIARWPVVLRSDALRDCANPGRGQRTAFPIADMKRYQRRALYDSVKLLAQDCMLVVFPEGYPNIDPHYTPKTRSEEFLPFKSGFAAIAAAAEKRLAARVPIVPISACLLGQKVRYDGGHKQDYFLTETFGRYVEWVPVCPELKSAWGYHGNRCVW